MDAYQHHHRYMRPPQPPLPPSSSSDPHHYLHHQTRPPVPPQGTWYSNQYHYQTPPPPPPPPSSSHSPSPPPPQHWSASPHSDHIAPLGPLPPPPFPLPSFANPPPPPLPNPFPSHAPPLNHQFPPRPHLPAPPPHSQIPQSYAPVNQEWGNQNWGQHQSLDYQAHSNAEDWAARARAWAAQKTAMEDHQSQSQFNQVGRTEEQAPFHDRYPQFVDTHYQDIQQQSFPASSYQHFQVSAAPLHQPPIVYSLENTSFNSGQSSNIPEGYLPYNVGAGTSARAPTTSPSVLQQEVPSSYSSVTGNEAAADQKDQLYKSLPSFIPSTQGGQHHMQSSMPALGGSVFTEQPYAYGNQGADPTDLSNQPLSFAPSFNRDHDPQMQSSYAAHHDSAGNVRGHGPVTPLSSVNSWNPASATGAVYPPIPPALPSGPQHDPSVAIPSPVPGHAAPPFGFPGTSFQPTIPSASVPYALGPGAALHPTAGFPGDAYGVSNISERPKKAPVPNWLKEEIIKNASVITRSSLEHPKEETHSIEDERVGKSFGQGDQADSKSIDSSRSTEEDEDEDDEETARTASINQEIKRVLTEVLLKVTDELFDDIATKVLHEDDLTVEVEHKTITSNHKVSPPLEVQTPKESAKVIVPLTGRVSDTEDISEKSSSSAPGNVLGLANYASDDEDDDVEVKSSSMSNFMENDVLQQSRIPKSSEDLHDADENGNCEMNSKGQANLGTNLSKTISIESKTKSHIAISELSESKVPSNVDIGVDSQKTKLPTNRASLNATHEENVADDGQIRESRLISNKDNRHDSKRSYNGKDVREAECGSRADERAHGNRGKLDDTNLRKEKTDDRNGSKERVKERSDKTGEKGRASESRKRSSHLDVKEDRKEVEKTYRSSNEDNIRKRGREKDNEDDRSRYKRSSVLSRHKRRHSSSTSSRGRNSKDNDSSDVASEDSKRKPHSRKRNLSPSPVRSRRRQVSKSPHSKHSQSQRRNSPYSSIESTRGRRSRSRSPMRRRR